METTQQGLWYDFNGNFTGLIHNQFSFYQNHELKMDFDKELTGYLSATETVDELFQWFSREDILKLQEKDWFIHKYVTDDYKFYDRFNHYVINQNKIAVLDKVILTK